MTWTRWLAVGTGMVVALAPSTAHAQPAWDIAGIAGFFNGHAPVPDADGYHEEWFQSAQGGVVLGRYLTSHLKLELEATATSGGTQYVSHRVAVPGLPTPYWLSSEVTTSVRSIGGVLAWQFRDNEWVHPFLAAGISSDLDRRSTYTAQQLYYPVEPRGAPPVLITEPRTQVTSAWHLRAAVAGGAKLYFRERAFVRTDGRITFGPDRQHLMFRVGLGVDF